MKDARIAAKAGTQFNRISLDQLRELGLSEKALRHRLRQGRIVRVAPGVFAVAPVDAENDWGRWMAATLTSGRSVLSHRSAAAARGFWTLPRPFEEITRPGSCGTRHLGHIQVRYSAVLAGCFGEVRGIPVTSAERTLLDLAPRVSPRALAWCVREAVRIEETDLGKLAEHLASCRGRRGAARLAATVSRYSGLPLERARSGAEVRALEILRQAERPLPALNVRRAGEEADLSWARLRLIIEIDGKPWHLDRGENARKQAIWEAAGWVVRRIDADRVYDSPWMVLALAPVNAQQAAP